MGAAADGAALGVAQRLQHREGDQGGSGALSGARLQEAPEEKKAAAGKKG